MRHIYQGIHRDLSSAKFTRVCRWEGRPVEERLAEFAQVLAMAKDEKPAQAFLENNLWIVAARWAPACAWVRAEAPIGSRFRTDFLVAREDSHPRVAWTMVELESPTVPLFTKKGRQADKLREGLAQVTDWRDWLIDHGDIARRPVAPGGEGLGYREIDRGALGAVVIGRRAAMSDSDRVNRRKSELNAVRTTITSYDSFIDYARRWADERGPCEECEYVTGA